MCMEQNLCALCSLAKAQVTYSGGRTIDLHVEEIQILKILDLVFGEK